MHRSNPNFNLLDRTWRTINSFILNLLLAVTFMLIPVTLAGAVYYTFFQFNFLRVILYLIFFCIMIWSNIKMKGA